MGIKDTHRLYDLVRSLEKRNELASNSGISREILLELTKLTDLSRIKWVSHTFARMLYDIGVDTVEEAANANYIDLHQKIVQLNKVKNIYKVQIGLNEMKIFVQAAREVKQEIQYE